MPLRRFAVLMFLLLATFAAHAQPAPLAAPSVLPERGARSTGIPYYVPGGITIRATAFPVTTTADEEDLSCDPDAPDGDGNLADGIGGTGRSLREAIEYCSGVDVNGIVYVPAGTYTLGDDLDSAFDNVYIIGEDPLTTIIENSLTPAPRDDGRMLGFDLANHTINVSNLTFRSGQTPGENGGAIDVYGSGWVTFHNVVFTDNTGELGGALYFSQGPFTIAISSATFADNVSESDGGALYVGFTGTQPSSISIADSVFENNAAGTITCSVGGGAVGIYSEAVAVAVSIDNVGFSDNDLACEGFQGAGMSFYESASISPRDVRSPQFVVKNSTFSGNTVAEPTSLGGGFAFESNALSNVLIEDSTFDHNEAGAGAGLWASSGGTLTIRGATIASNTAMAYGGGLSTEFTLTHIDDTIVSGNWVTGYDDGSPTEGTGGGAILWDGDVLVTGSQFFGNAAGTSAATPLPGFGGGIYIDDARVALQDTLIEDNSAVGGGPDCLNDGSYDIDSLGGVGITVAVGCFLIEEATDQYNNLLLNGGFEFAGANAKTPSDWTVSGATGEKRECNSETKTVAAYGNCAFKFSGGTGESSSIKQNVDFDEAGLGTGDMLRLFAEGSGKSSSKVKVTMIATYVSAVPNKAKVKLNFNGAGATDGWDALEQTYQLLDDLTKLQVKVSNTSTSGKFYLDRVYLFEPAAVLRGEVAPPPAAPSGFRGGF